MEDVFFRCRVPFFPDATIWEGMINGTLFRMIQLSCGAAGLAAISFAVSCWNAHRVGTASSRKSE